MKGENALNKAIEHLQVALDELEARAKDVADRYWNGVYEKEKQHPGWENRSDLSLRVRRKGNALMAEWRNIRWVGSKAKGNRRAIADYIKRPDGEYGYNVAKLRNLAKDWEKPLVEKTEAEMKEVRRRWRHITKAIKLIKVVHDLETKG